ncbi:MAG: hypothetical protein OXF66_02495 [Gammaproteobacteria bacterium]|nr:hypothetical protein [Gammaproteobacteria bacterium]MCY4254510.1 hypothetical protein [Gammaproteobacteria bacterium]MCY4341437.1 hypothetical protein [Gammaproteobacteria bacterium]
MMISAFDPLDAARNLHPRLDPRRIEMARLLGAARAKSGPRRR